MRELSADEINEVLIRNGIGTLALLDDDVPYPIPMSFGYDGEKPLFVMQFGDAGSSRKIDCVDTSRKAGFTVYEQLGDGLDSEWRSVVMSGTLRETDERDPVETYATLASNAEFAPDVKVWDAPLEEVELSLFELDVEERSGRSFSVDG